MSIGKDHFHGGQNQQPGGQRGSEATAAGLLGALQADARNIAGLRGLPALVSIATTAVTSADASDQATLNTLLNEQKADFNLLTTLANEQRGNLHKLGQFAVALAAAEALPVGKPAAIDLATSVVLVNELKAKYNSYLRPLANELKADLNTDGTIAIAAPDAAAEASADATDLATAITLANSLKTNINAARTLLEEVRTDYDAVAGRVVLNSPELK